MDYIFNGLLEALKLLISFDLEIYSILGLSVVVSLTSTVFASLFGVFGGIVLGLYDFRFKGFIIRIVYAFMALPPVVVGLFVAIILSRRGPMGSLELLFTPTAMIIAQTILITPIITGLIYNATKAHGETISQVSMSLGGTVKDQILLVFTELKKKHRYCYYNRIRKRYFRSWSSYDSRWQHKRAYKSYDHLYSNEQFYG